jgi:hypothetical protein
MYIVGKQFLKIVRQNVGMGFELAMNLYNKNQRQQSLIA